MADFFGIFLSREGASVIVDELALPQFFGALFPFLSEGTGRVVDAKTKPMKPLVL